MIERKSLTLDDEQPLPARNGVLNLEDAIGNKATESTSKQRTTKEDRNAESKLATRVEQRQIENNTCKEPSFERTKQKAKHKHTSKILCRALHERHCAPG